MMLIFNNELKNIMRLKERDLIINDLTEFMGRISIENLDETEFEILRLVICSFRNQRLVKLKRFGL